MHLYAAFLGGPMSDGRMGEGHEVVMVVASDLDDAKSRAKAKWNGEGGAMSTPCSGSMWSTGSR